MSKSHREILGVLRFGKERRLRDEAQGSLPIQGRALPIAGAFLSHCRGLSLLGFLAPLADQSRLRHLGKGAGAARLLSPRVETETQLPTLSRIEVRASHFSLAKNRTPRGKAPQVSVSDASYRSYVLALLVSAFLHAGIFLLPRFESNTQNRHAGPPGARVPLLEKPELMIIPIQGSEDWHENEPATDEAGKARTLEEERVTPIEPPLAYSPGKPEILSVSLGNDGAPTGLGALMSGAEGFALGEAGCPGFGPAPASSGRGGKAYSLSAEFTPAPRYPPKARQESREGTVELAVSIDREGRIVSVNVSHSSGHSDLDQSAVETVAKRWRLSRGSQTQSRQILIHFDLRSPDRHDS